MRDNRRYLKLLIFAAAAMVLITGCKGKDKETQKATEPANQSEAETEAVLEKVTYTAADGNVSIILPDSTWKNTADENGSLSFVSEGWGEITIKYAQSSDEVGTLVLGSTEARLQKRMKKAGLDTENIGISNLNFDKSTGVRLCSYTLKYNDTAAGDFYTVTSVSTLDDRGYQVSGTIKKDDLDLLANVQESVNSFLILKNPLSGDAGDSNSGNSADGAEGSSSTGDWDRYFFDEEGNTIYVSENADGNWVDKNGTSYTFLENGVKDNNGTKYYYDPPTYRDGNSGNSSGTGNSADSSETADYHDFYDKDGNYIKARQDENGNWADDNGKTYVFGEKGVTDADGNFHPY